MINRKLLAVCLLAALLAAMIPGRVARSDAAPPRSPSGSNVVPGQATNVRMLAENVLLWIQKGSDGDYHAEVTADFLFRNQGNAGESMQVRFPMENIDGIGDGYGGRPLIRNFSAQADGVLLAVQTATEPFKYGPVIQWSTFPVSFPADRDVLLRVNYETDLTKGKGYKSLGYILETGAGWYGTIGSAVITYRFPYAVSPVNTPNTPDVLRVGREVRFLYSDFEPDPSFNTNLIFVDPAVWQNALDLESYTGEHPQDIPSILQLADTYRDMCNLNPDSSQLAETIVDQALTYSPDSADLHAELAWIYTDRSTILPMSNCYRFPEKEPERSQTIAGLQRELKRAFELDPQNAKALELQGRISSDLKTNWDSLSTSIPTIPATEAATIATPEEAGSTPVTMPVTPTAQSILLPVIAGGGSGTNETGQAETPSASAGIPAGWLIAAAVAGLAAGILLAILWRRWSARSVLPRTKPRE
jgi:hypothetical protein